MPVLSPIAHWGPFKLDALGIITTLGAESVRNAVGRMVFSPLAEYLPIMAPQVIADNSIATPIPGFRLYNISDGIFATHLAAWFTRWLLAQELNWSTTAFTLTIADPATERPIHQEPLRKHLRFLRVPDGHIAALQTYLNYLPERQTAASVALHVLLAILPILLGDWYGVAASLALTSTVITRVAILSSMRTAIHTQTRAAQTDNSNQATARLFVILPNGRAATIVTTRGIADNCLLAEPWAQNKQQEQEQQHTALRTINSAAFCILVVSLGMACLVMQLVIVTVMLLGTAMLVSRIGCDETRVAGRLRFDRAPELESDKDTRTWAYVRLDLSEDEERTMLAWGLFPPLSKVSWWNRYRHFENRATMTDMGIRDHRDLDADESLYRAIPGLSRARAGPIEATVWLVRPQRRELLGNVYE
ncbi:uncharacterized protein DSM5745_08620 [Aspergillus mulundensis]|uniref:Uncharacterized protein n=1 Tax=Aspergillus mulundensis TaxID=1810919 RepID=A0A3D8R4G2_9EURO|nr:hypothetical protein DSM5745_08620 [Aspergillus mulundensis]RDW68860.1 hypothetical protein DSM5745_08620 [Aspergillus mulundensis]